MCANGKRMVSANNNKNILKKREIKLKNKIKRARNHNIDKHRINPNVCKGEADGLR
jgi:hypothetical protein